MHFPTYPKRPTARAVLGLVIAFGLACCLPALYHTGGGPSPISRSGTDWGYECLGSLPFVALVAAWWANPLFFIGLVLLSREWRWGSFLCGLVATGLALTTFLCPDVELVLIGFFVWLGCMIGLTVASWFCPRNRQSEE